MGKPERQPPAKAGTARPSAAADRKPTKPAGGATGGGGGGIDRSKCELVSRKGDDLKLAIYSCACGAQLTGFTAWRNHLKKSKKFRKFKEEGAKVYQKRRLSMRPAEQQQAAR